MQKISIIYADSGKGSDWCELYMAHLLGRRGFSVELFDVSSPGLPEGELILNRVYPSLSNGNGVAERALEISELMEQKGRRVINSSRPAAFDYDKFAAYERMREAGIPTPETFLIDDFSSAIEVCETLGYPVVMKRNTGGGSKGVKMLKTREEAEIKIRECLKNNNGYHGEIILQEFIRPQRDYDIRVGVVGGEPRICYGRTLISLGEEEPWIASVKMGSRMIDCVPTKEEIDISVRATTELGADINEVDVHLGPDGPVIIENNLTPGYDDRETHRVLKIAEYITGEIA